MIYPDSELASQARQRYYALNGLPSDGGFQDPWARYRLGPVQAIAFPNFPHRVQSLRRHDLHHIINDLDTSPLGEGLIAAWELGSGCGRFWLSWLLESQALWWAIVLAPRRMLSFYILGRHSRNYFHEPFDEEALLRKTVGELRAELLPKTSVSSMTLRDILFLIGVAVFGLLSMLGFFPLVTIFTLIGLFVDRKRQ